MLRRFITPRGLAAPVETPRLLLCGTPLEKTRNLYRDWTEGGGSGSVRPLSSDISLHWVILLKESGEDIGNVGVISHDLRNRRCEIGYCIDAQYAGKGLMTEAVRAMTHFLLFDIGFNRIEARHAPENPASGKVLRKAGMIYEGCARQRRLKDGVYADRLQYSLLFDDIFPKFPGVTLTDFGTLTDGEIDVVCDKILSNPAETDYVPSYDAPIRLHGKPERIGYIRLSVGFSDTLYYGGHIGYRIDEPYRGHHYAAKACALIKPVALSYGLSPIIITCNPDNAPSGKTLLRIGAECVRKCEIPPDNPMYSLGSRQKLIFEWR